MTDDDLRGRLTRVEATVNDISARVVALEKADAIADVHRKNVEVRLATIESNTTWLIRLIVGALVMALLAYALKGGLTVA